MTVQQSSSLHFVQHSNFSQCDVLKTLQNASLRFVGKFSNRVFIVSISEKSGIPSEYLSHDGPDKRWTLAFSPACLFGCTFV